MSEKEEENIKDINYHYINTSLELVKGVPAITLIAWLPSLLFMNIPAIIFSVIFSIIIIFLYRSGFSIIETISIVKYILRNQKPRLFKDEDKYEKHN